VSDSGQNTERTHKNNNVLLALTTNALVSAYADKSPYIKNVILVYDRGEFVNMPVTIHDSENGRDISGLKEYLPY
jgi:hypothetical protein